MVVFARHVEYVDRILGDAIKDVQEFQGIRYGHISIEERFLFTNGYFGQIPKGAREARVAYRGDEVSFCYVWQDREEGKDLHLLFFDVFTQMIKDWNDNEKWRPSPVGIQAIGE